MPDISLLVELSEFYQVSIPEIINGERKSEKMNQETKDTAIKMAEYSKNELNAEKRKIISILLLIFGVFIIISALAIFPNESSWGSIYAIIGGAISTVGIYFRIKFVLVKRVSRILSVVGWVIVLFGIFTISDYIAVTQFHQVPRFSYDKSYGEDIVEHKTIFHLAHPTSFLFERRIDKDRSMDTITREARLKNNAALSISESIPCL